MTSIGGEQIAWILVKDGGCRFADSRCADTGGICIQSSELAMPIEADRSGCGPGTDHDPAKGQADRRLLLGWSA